MLQDLDSPERDFWTLYIEKLCRTAEWEDDSHLEMCGTFPDIQKSKEKQSSARASAAVNTTFPTFL